MTKTRIIKLIALIMMIFTLGFIFYNSILSQNDSLNLSSGFLDRIKPILRIIIPEKFLTVNYIRKAAHFTEFAVLGIELSVIFIYKENFNNINKVLLTGLISALTDETIQFFTKRGSSVIDVWIDFSGVFTAAVIFILITLVLNNIFKETN